MLQQVILDTNVLVAAGFNKHSSSARIIENIRHDELDLIWHQATHTECQKIICQIPPLQWQSFEDLFKPENEYRGKLAIARFTPIADVDDRKFAALAAATGGILISNDRHFLTVRHQLNITIMSPAEFQRSG